MHFGTLVPKHLQPRQCISCPPAPQCTCGPNQSCFQINRDCNTCATFKCVSNTSTSSSGSSGGTSTGALAGAVVGSLVALAAAIGLFFWYRRRRGIRAAAILEAKADVPAPVEDVLNRPDPSEKLTSRSPTELINTRVYSTQSDGTIDLDPESQRTASGRVQSQRASAHSNPFSDGRSSIQTTGSTGTEGMNVIPIALVPPGSVSTLASSNGASENHPLTPVRPARSPELDLGMDRVNVSHDGPRLPYAQSQISGVSGVSSRNSYISNMSYSSEFLNEAPVIVSPTQGGVVRQVIGSVKAEMVSASGSSASTSPTGLGPSLAPRPPVRSPLAASSFVPSDVLREHEEEPELPVRSPFDDENSPKKSDSNPKSVTTYGLPSPNFTSSRAPSPADTELPEPNRPWAQSSESSRPSSVSTQAGSIIADIGSATRVNVGLGGLQSGSTLSDTLSTAGQNLRSPYRTTMGRLVNPSSTENLGTLEQQQQRALDHAQAQAQAQGGERSRRVSGSSAISNTADSILESFPFVPPSPISDRPIRSPPHSPLNHPTFAPGAPEVPTPPPPPEPLNPPQNRRNLGMSSGSQLSTASSGLGSFPFQIDSYPLHEGHGGAAPSSFAGRQRASLDTLALTSDLSSYPLGYDRAELRDSYPTN